ncbi:MAG: type II secretion system F family protein [Verrucomicrobiota bacterium]
MPEFQYKARTRNDSVTTGVVEANDRRQATQRLREQKLAPISLKPVALDKPKRSTALLKGKFSKKLSTRNDAGDDKTIQAQGGRTSKEGAGLNFLKRLLELHGSGLPMGDSIRILSQKLSDPEQKQLAQSIWRDLSEGGTLASAMARRPKYFSNSITYVIEAGEATGRLEPILHKVIDYMEEKQAIRKKMLSSMAYPATICTVAVLVVILFLTVLLPQIQGMLDKLGGEMSLSARILIDGSDFLIKFGPFIVAAIVLLTISYTQWRKTEKGRATTDRWLLRLPLVGKIFYYSDLFQCGNLISTLLDSGINTTEALRLTERAIRNTDLQERFRIARGQVNEGLSVAQALKRNQFFPELAVDILSVGEDTGNLGHSITELTKGFREELTMRLNRMTTLVSSGALVSAFLLVTLIAIGIVTSVFAVSKTLS